ncbi:Translational activator gcn1 [Leucoagaricus sp. SymC.cos]|nr:Translational activator gcn1 [Leucoagaricus sp. SymC.cos]
MSESDNVYGEGGLWVKERFLNDWSASLEYARSKLLIEKVKGRVAFLEEVLTIVKSVDLSLSQILDVFQLLTLTYPRYGDEKSQAAVQAVGMELVLQDEKRETKLGVSEGIIGWLSNEVGRYAKRNSADSYAPADLFVLLSWTCGIYTICVKENENFSSSPSFKALIGSAALLFDMVLESSKSKATLKRGALTRTRRALRSSGSSLPAVISTLLALVKANASQNPIRFVPLIGVAIAVLARLKHISTPPQERLPSKLQSGSSLPAVISTLLALVKANASQNPIRFVPLIGVAIAVLARLKHISTPPQERLPSKLQSEVTSIYTSTILMSKTPIPPHVLTSLEDFISTYITSDSLKSDYLPTIEKALLRSPEIALSTVTSFFQFYHHILEETTFQRILAQIISSSKSSNALTRSSAIKLFQTISTSASTHGVLAVNEFATPLLAKEPNEGATAALASSLGAHVIFLLKNDSDKLKDVTQLLVKEMNNTRPAVKRAFVSLAGEIFYEGGDFLEGEKGVAFAKALEPAFETSLKNVSGNAINNPAGAFEGYVAIAVLLGPLLRPGQFSDMISKNAVIGAIATSSAKPSFLLWDRVYQKVTEETEEKWLLRALEVSLKYFQKDLKKNAVLRKSFGSILLHLAVESSHRDIRQATNNAIKDATIWDPELTTTIIRETVVAFLSLGSILKTSSSERAAPRGKHMRLASILLSAVSYEQDAEVEVKERLVTELAVVAHHEHVSGPMRQTWIDVCQKANTDPKELIEKHVDKLLKLVLESTTVDVELGFPEASYHTVTTLTFIAPTIVLPRIMDQLKADLDPSNLNSLTDFDYGVWQTPEGTAFVDVLSTNKDTSRAVKGKDAQMAKWDEEVRKSLANKKGNAPALTKQQQALINAQLEKEEQTRQRVVGIKVQLERGLALVKSVIDAGVEEFPPYIAPITKLLLEGVLRSGKALIGQAAFDVYLELAKCSSERLDTFRKWLGIASLRSLNIDAVPEDLQAEPLNSLIIRVLYRLRFLAEQSPFDASTFSYAFPLLEQVIQKGGINAEEEEEALEQVALALDFIKFHCGEFSDSAYPRKRTMEQLLHLIRNQPKLSKSGSSTLIDLGEAISPSATREEMDVLLKGILAQESHLRNSCLQAIQPFDLTDLDWSSELWIACHDDDEQNARLARHAWEDNGLDVPETYLDELVGYLDHQNIYVRSSVAAAIGESVEQLPQTVQATVIALQEYYREKAKLLLPEYDEYGMILAHTVDRPDPWQTRQAIAQAFEYITPSFTDNLLEPFFDFLIQDQALGDRAAEVRKAMLTAGTTTIDLHGAKRLATLISLFESHLAKKTPATDADDQIKEAVVILFGRVAHHLDPSDERIPAIVDRLVEALATPARLMWPKLPSLIDHLFDQLFNAPKYAIRRGAAYGLAGVLRGTGIAGMQEFGVLSKLQVAAEEKRRYEHRQGVMFAFETLSAALGRLFEPYVTLVLPVLLSGFGDSTNDVREAAQDAARVLMGSLSGYGLKLILPTLLDGLNEKQWRTKKGSIEVLGMMAYCSPRQLSLSLAQVKSAANKSLKQFGEVISNPEIQSLVPVLLKALVDPVKTPNALIALLKMSFMHYIDHSSLALVIPILQRGLKERGADTKKKAAQIVGNLASLTDSKDFVPYLDNLLPLVHLVLVDPVPEARATAAKTLGTLVERLGEVHFPDLVPGLLRTLKADTSGVDRQGAAQGLSEVLAGLGMERMEGLLPDIIVNARSPRSTVREGFMSLLVYLPATFGTRFQPHLPKIISPILGGLSDTEEYVREAAMRAGRMVVTNYSTRAVDLLLPELERGMFDPGWRIRQSSITLVGELLFKVSGISGKTSDGDEEEEEAEAVVAESSRRALAEALGAERRDRILAALYLVRQDGVLVVRQSSMQIWKALVHNTPKTVREILPELIRQIVFLISGDEPEQQETSGRTVADISRKFGERIVGEMMQLLKDKSQSTDARTREGVCLTLTELMRSTTDTQREGHEDNIISIVRVSLVDDEPDVRSAAARAFDVLQEHIGGRAIDLTIPTLLEALRQPGKGSGTALQALREVMTVRASTVFPVLIPTLTAIPMTVFNARALAALVTVAGNALSRRLNVIMNAVVRVFEEEDKDKELRDALDEAIKALLTSINDAEGLNTLMMLLIGWAKADQPQRRVSACDLFALFCEVSELDSSLYRIDWIRQLITLMEDSVVVVHTAALHALDAFVKSVPKDELEPLVVPLRRSIESTGAPGMFVPGFSLPKGVAPTVPIIIAGLTTGSNEQREQAAYAIGDLVERTEEGAIKPYVVSFTGPLIRVATQAMTYPPGVKTAILSALTSMLERIPAFVKPFFPQLQRTFVKSASDSSSNTVRNRAANALGVLMKHQPRVDPVITELITGVKSNDDTIASNLVLALAKVVQSASQNLGDKAREACVELVSDSFRAHHDEHYCQSLGLLVVALSDQPELLRPTVVAHLSSGTPPSVLSSHVLRAILSPDDGFEDPVGSMNLFQKLDILRTVAQKTLESAANEKPIISRPAREARDALKGLDDPSLRGLF